MAEPSFDPFAGLKYGVLLAGFAGGVASLSFVRDLNRTQSVLAVLTGMLSANYLTPVATYYISHWGNGGAPLTDDMHYAAAFLVGLTAMNIIPGIIKLSLLFRHRPQSFLPNHDPADRS